MSSRKRLVQLNRQSLIESLESRTLLSAVKIMPLGDSITQAEAGHASYRYWLYKDLVGAGYDVNFVGSQNTANGGPTLYSDFDPDHEGHFGYRADQILSGITAWAQLNTPDIVLLHIGTNDIYQGQSNSSTITDISGIIDDLRSVNSKVEVLLAEIIPSTVVSGISTFNSLIPGLISQKNTAQSPVILVDQNSGFNASTDTYDGIHPTAGGEQKMATKWFNALTNILPSPTPTPPSNTTYLSDKTPTTSTNGWGPIENDHSNGENGAGDGGTITLNGVTYAKGLGVHASSSITYNLGGQYSEFLSDIGVDDEAAAAGSIVFQVYVDNVLKFTSPTMLTTSATQTVDLSVAGATTLRLVVGDSGNGNASDHGDWANARLLTSGTPAPAPAAPNLTGALSAQQINLNWTETSTSISGYRIERKAGATGVYAQIADLASTKLTYSDPVSGLLAGTTYYYHVYAYNSGGNSTFSNEINAATPAAPPPPPPPTGTTYFSDLTFTVNANGWGPAEKDRSNGETGAADGKTITLNGVTYAKGVGVHASSDITFNLAKNYTQFISDIGVDDEVANNGSVDFQVYVDGVLKFDSGTMTGATATKTATVDVTGGSTLRLVVTDAGNGNGSDHADWANARLIAAPQVPPPTTPASLTATFNTTTNKIDLSWVDSANDQTGFRIERKTGVSGVYAQIADLPASTFTYSDANNLVFGTTYYYHVYAYETGAPNSVFSNESNASVPTPPAPATPDSLTATYNSTTTKIDLAWADAANDETGFRIERKTGVNGTYAQIADLAAGTFTYSDGNNLVGGSTYYYHVYAYQTGAPNSAFSNEPNASTPVVPAPATPSGLTSTYNATTKKIDLSWSDPTNDQTGFRIERKTGVNGTYAQIADLTAGTFTYSDAASLVGGNTYYYHVYAYQTGAPNSGFSNEVNAAVPVPPSTSSFLSDLAYTVTSNGWGPPEKDRSNGETGAADGKTITLNGVTYAKGLGVHANSDVSLNLNKQYSTFTSDIGVDDEVANNGSVDFQVYLDNVLIYDSGKMTGATATKSVTLNIAGGSTLRLVVTDAGDGNAYDHADWAGAKLST